MTSLINPNNIDGAYPVAGQDNNSQGFRDNFTNTKTNFQYASEEITDLQNKAVLKSALTGSVLNNNMNGSILSNVQLQDESQTRVALGTLGGSITLNYAAGSYQTVAAGGNISLNFINFPPAGAQGSLILQVTVSDVAHTLTLPKAVGFDASARSVYGIQGIVFNGGDPINSPGSYTGSTITFAETGTYELQFDTNDNGSTIYLSELTRPRNRYTNPLFLAVPDTYTGTGNVSLTSTTTLFGSSANVAGNLLAGSVGQIKILAYANTLVGNTVITVTNAAWGGSNQANLSAVGSACTLQWIGAKWFCVGNNGVAFS